MVVNGVFQCTDNSGDQRCLSVVCLFVGQFNVRFEYQGKKVSFGEVVYKVKKSLLHRSVLHIYNI